MARVGRPRLPIMEEALREVVSGKTITEVSRVYGISYQTLYAAIKARGISGGYKQRDMRPLVERAKEFIRIDVEDHWYWCGRDPRGLTTDPAYRSERNLARLIAGQPARRGRIWLGQACGKSNCINPDHENSHRFQKRDAEILLRWKASEEAKKCIVTMDQLSKEYGLTRQRIQQIIAGAEQGRSSQ
jgi:transposase-like protein